MRLSTNPMTRVALLLAVSLLSGCQLFTFVTRDRSTDPTGDRPLTSGKMGIDTRRSLAEARARYSGAFESFDRQIRFDPSFPTIALKAVPPSKATAQPVPKAAQTETPSEIELAKSAPTMTPDGVIRDAENIRFCKRIDRKLSSVSFRNCLLREMRQSGFRTTRGNPIYHVNFHAKQAQKPLGRVLVLGGVHGDELTSVSTVYLWIKTLNRFHSGLFDWRVVPLVNPDGFFLDRPTRTNGNGIDLNRNMPTYQWNQLATRYWKKQASGTERKFPGFQAASEPETQWLIEEIKAYKPDVIITVHAPYNLVDYDAADRSSAPRRLGILRGRSLGTFPGSLGRYAGEERNIPVITLELPHSTRMPSARAIDGIWLDMVSWLRQHINTHNIAGRSFNHCDRTVSASGCI